jgi:hypothetical protein
MGNKIDRRKEYTLKLLKIDQFLSKHNLNKVSEFIQPAQSIDEVLDDSADRVSGLESTVKEMFERAFGADFSAVKIHTGPDANNIARSIGAQAFTTGSDIYFRDGTFSTDTESGLKLLAHELTHVVQFSSGEKMDYFEDINDLEAKANAIEELLDEMPLHNITTPILNGNDTTDFKKEEKDDNRESADSTLSKSENGGQWVGGGESLKDYAGNAGKGTMIELALGTGKKISMTVKEYEEFIEDCKKEIMEKLNEDKINMQDKEFSQYLLRFIRAMK